MVSLKDVAKLASVSLMTVSRALNDPDKLSEKTLTKVRKAIAELNYVPDFYAQKIRKDNTGPKSIGVLGIETAITPFSVEIHQAIEQTAQSFNWNIFIVNLFNDKDSEQAINNLLSYRPDGIIYTSMGFRKIEIPQRLQNHNVVLANCITDSGPFPSYIPDDYTGQLAAIENVLSKGYKKPLCIMLSEKILATPIRKQAIDKAWVAAGRCLDDLTYHFLPLIPEHSEQEYLPTIDILKAELSTNPQKYDIIICGNDRVAFVVYQYVLSLKLGIPNHIAVLGFDDMVGVGQLFYPPLTTIKLPHYEIGKQAALHIINDRSDKEATKLDCPYVERDSL